MRLTFLMVILCATGLFAGDMASQITRVSISANNVPLRGVISEIEKQTDYLFVYDQSEVNVKQQVSVEAREKTVAEVLTNVLKNTDIIYAMEGENIMLMRRTIDNSANQQPVRKISGTVLDASGEPLVGASVVEKGTKNGTSTDIDGNFTLTVNDNSVLEVSYLGFLTSEIAVGNKNSLQITLSEDTQALGEVVVTALGIKREKKALGYAIQDVKGDRLTESRDANVANALAGKIAGVQIRQNGTGIGGSTRITIRGNNTIAGNNQPLIVVDGVPIDNFASSPDDYWGNSQIDKGSGLGDIAPDNIESISVLKGPAASALYGSRAANGVFLVTTKNGSGAKGKGVGISLSSNLTVENPMQVPEFQNEYGQGTGGVFNNNVTGSWGPKMDGSVKEMALGSFPYSARDNDIYKDFLQTGSTWTNSLELAKATEDMTFRAGVTRLDNQSVVPNSGLDRTSIDLRATAKMAKWLSVDVKINYINQNTKNRISIARDPNNIFMDNLYRPRSVAFSDYAAYEATDWKRADGKPAAYVLDHNAAPDNVFWSVYRNRNSDKRDRYIGMAALDFTLTDWLSLKLRSGMDNYTFLYDMTRATGNPYWESEGSYRLYTERFKEINSDFLFTAKKDWGQFGAIATFGGNIRKVSNTLSNDFSGALEVPDFYSISAGREHYAQFSSSEKQVNSLYGTLSLSYEGQYYLDLTGRNDWSSTLSKENNSYFYPSVGASWVFSETLKRAGIGAGPLSFGKLRASWARVGNDTDPYRLINTYSLNYNVKEGTMQVTRDDWRANPNLKNETVQSIEAGLEVRAWDDRVGLDLSWYKMNAFDQILKVALPPATGYKYDLINAGNIQNTGWEAALNATPVKTRNLTWETTLNWSTNKNKVIELREGLTSQDLSLGALPISIVAEVGGSYGDIYGTAYLRDDNGNKIIDANGIPVMATERKKLGNAMPDGMLGWSNTFNYKNMYLSFLIDLNYGGSIFMGSINMGTNAGTLAMTADHRDGGLIVEGVNQSDGKPNTTAITAQQYWTGINGINEEFLYDATNARFRELTFGYNLPASLLKNTPFAAVKASLVARNLFMIYSKTKGFDPEAGYSSASSALGAEYCSMPTMRSIGFNIKVTF
ncbi:MAG: SusC/RagA family TonB-linked outer membrane protein [Dysgonamonadaceae bacterium]|nr:SusC/RagA family TonB-linked outer membrane protein [Dysgonamonadaceae bacterium]